MTSYILYSNGVIEADGLSLSINELNLDYQEYVAWLELGNTPTKLPASDYLAKQNDDKIDRDKLRVEYLSTLNTLSQIENATSPTNAQVIAAVKFLAKTLRLLLRLLARLV